MLSLNHDEMRARARSDLRMGAPVAVVAGGEGLIAIAAEAVTADRLDALRALGPLDLAVTVRRAETLKARAYDGDLARIIVDERMGADLVQGVADPSLALNFPLQGPYVARRDGSAAAHRLALKLAKSARVLPAVVAAPLGASRVAEIAATSGFTLVSEELMAASDEAAATLTHISSARVPLAVSEAGRVHVFRPLSGEEEHYAVEIGEPDRAAPVLSRLHSACFTGDLVGSLKCDCGPQLRAALAQIGAEGSGVLLYLNQEGRGIGLANKMRAYSLQDEGFDTVDANHRLGFEDDERDFRIGARILEGMGFSAVRLMTNNPGKVAAMEAAGIRVAERVPLKVGETRFNTAYLATKAKKSGHLL